MIENSPLGNTSIELSKAYMIYQGPHLDMHYRPFESNITGSGIQGLLDVTQNGQMFNNVSLSNIASSLIMPSVTPKGKVFIPNSFGSGRFAFFLEITISSPLGNRRELITGFTDHDGVLPSGAIDPELEFHINSVSEIVDFTTQGVNGINVSMNNRNSSQVIASSMGNSDMVSLRPEDVIRSGQMTAMFPNDIRNDTRVIINDSAKLSDRNNVLPAHYLNKSVKAYLNSAREVGSNDSSASEDLYDGAISRVVSPTVGTSKFYNSIGIREPRATHMVKYGEINGTWPRQHDFWKVVMPRPGATMTSPAMNSEGWGGAAMSQQIAYGLTHAIPAVMARNMLMSLEFTATNQTADGSVLIAIVGYTEMFDGTTTVNTIELIKDQILNDLIRGIILNRTGSFTLSARTNIITDSTFMIGLNGEQAIPFVAPMFCDSYYSPVIGQGTGGLADINRGIESIVGSLDTTGIINQHYDPITSGVPVPPTQGMATGW